MNDEKFNELLNGPLWHPMPAFIITRLALALRCVVKATGEAGEKALLDFCNERQERDDNAAG